MTTPDIRELQAPLRERYTTDPATAHFTLRVFAGETDDQEDPFHSDVTPASVPATTWHSGAHPGVGGPGDTPCSGDLLLAALAACQEVTIRMVAAAMKIPIAGLDVVAEGDWDVRGTLAMGDHPVGITSIRCATTVQLAEGVNAERAERLLRSAERYCVVLNTLRAGVEVDSTFTIVND